MSFRPNVVVGYIHGRRSVFKSEGDFPHFQINNSLCENVKVNGSILKSEEEASPTP